MFYTSGFDSQGVSRASNVRKKHSKSSHSEQICISSIFTGFCWLPKVASSSSIYFILTTSISSYFKIGHCYPQGAVIAQNAKN